MTDHSRLTDCIFTGVVSRFGVPLRSKSAGETVFNYWKTANRVAQEVIFLEAAEEAEKQNAASKVEKQTDAVPEEAEDFDGMRKTPIQGDPRLDVAHLKPPGDSLEEKAPRTMDKTGESTESTVSPGGLVEPREVKRLQVDPGFPLAATEMVNEAAQDVAQIRADQAAARKAREKEAYPRGN